MYTRSLEGRAPKRKAVLTSAERSIRLCFWASESSNLMEACEDTGEKVLSKSIPCFCRKPRATRRHLYLSIDPSGRGFTLKTQRPEIMLALCGSESRSTTLKTPSLFRESISEVMAAFQFPESLLPMASSYDEGSRTSAAKGFSAR